jgi:hypothetical protein
MAIETLEFDTTAQETIDRLKAAFRVRTTAEVVSRAIALADEAQKYAGSRGVIILSGESGTTKVDLAR